MPHALCQQWGCPLTLSVKVHHQVLEDVHVSSVGNGGGGGGGALAVDVGDGLGPHVEHQGVHQSDVVLVPRLRGNLHTQRGRWCGVVIWHYRQFQ